MPPPTCSTIPPRRGQIDQIRVVRERMGDSELAERRLKARRFGLRDRFGPPLIVVLREQLDALAAAVAGGLDGLVVAPRDRLMGAEDGHGVGKDEGGGMKSEG